MDTEDNNQKKILQSQGIKLSRPDMISRPRNRIEEALAERQRQNNQIDPFLPQIKKTSSVDEPLKIIQENIPQARVNPLEREQKPKKSPKIFRIIKPLLILVILFAIVGLVAYGAYVGVTKLRGNSITTPENMIKEIGKLTILPQGETPTIVTVANLEPLKGQPIFQNAKVGDTLLIYTKAKRAILYRSSEKMVIVNATLTD